MTKKAKPTKSRRPDSPKSNDFESVARRLGADEDKARFEEKLKKIAKSKSGATR